MSIYVDRAIAAEWFYEAIVEHPQLEIITWEKGYKASAQPLQRIDGQLRLQRARNHAEDLQEYHLRYQRGPWKKNPQLVQWIVEATNPKNRTITASILATDQQARNEEVIKGMFSRWLLSQEKNRRIEKTAPGRACHPGKSASSTLAIKDHVLLASGHYKRLAQLLEDKQEKSGGAKALRSKNRNASKNCRRSCPSMPMQKRLKGRKDPARPSKPSN